MPGRTEFRNFIAGATSHAFISTLAVAAVLTLTIAVSKPVHAQTYSVIYSFVDGTLGWDPSSGVQMDLAGNLYGTTSDYRVGGSAYKLVPKGSGWVLSQLHHFGADGDGAIPAAGVVFGPDERLYGTTFAGGASGNGIVFALSPSSTICPAVTCPWTEAVLYSFTGGNDANPAYGDLVFDTAGNIYGTTTGTTGTGLVYELMPSGSGWTENVLHTFEGSPDGYELLGGVILDSAGNVYGTTVYGGASDVGMVFKLTYSSGSGWTESVLHNFGAGNDGGDPFAGLIFDPTGNLYGATTTGGQGGGGTVFKLTPSGSGWNFSVIYSFTGNGDCGPWAPLSMDTAGNLYGTTYCDGANGAGNIFELTSTASGWIYTSLKDFSIDRHDGSNPISSVIMDSHGNLYGTASSGGTGCRYTNCGVVWEITP